MLSDPKKRAAYDTGGFGSTAGIPPEDLFAGVNFDEIFGGLGFGMGEGLFDRFFGRRRHAGPVPGRNLELTLEVTLEKIARGGEETLHVKHPGACTACHGSGARAGTAPRSCDTCHGSGQHVSTRVERGMTVRQITVCGACNGRGNVIDQPCGECHGSGVVERDETIAVKIPAGLEEGTMLRIPGRGLPGRDPGAPAGDLFVTVYSAPDPRFERRGADLWHSATIPLHDAVLGNSLEVPTLEGHAAVKVPPGTQPDSVLRLRGKGLPRFGGGGRGGLFVRLQVAVPTELSTEERKLYEQLRLLARKSRP